MHRTAYRNHRVVVVFRDGSRIFGRFLRRRSVGAVIRLPGGEEVCYPYSSIKQLLPASAASEAGHPR